MGRLRPWLGSDGVEEVHDVGIPRQGGTHATLVRCRDPSRGMGHGHLGGSLDAAGVM